MLNEYLPNKLLKEEYLKRDYILSKVEKDDNWKGGQIIVPFKSQGASSVKFGALTASNDVAESKYQRGTISSYKEAWGSLIFNHTDLIQHDGKIKESTFLRVLPDTINDFMDYFKMCMSIQLGTGPQFATATDSTNAASGIFIVDRVDRFCLDQKCTLDDDDSAATSVYVIAINVNTSAVTFSATRGGSAANLSAYTVAQNAKFYPDGVSSSSDTFQSIKDALLSAANGGGASLHGKTKLSFPYLQAVNVDGSSVTAANIVEKIFDAYVDVRKKARGQANEVLMSFTNLGSVLKAIELGKGDFKVSEGSNEASIYGWDKIEVMQLGSRKRLTLVGIQEMDDDVIFFLDWSAFKFHSNGFIRKHKSPDGVEYSTTRATTGYSYIVDIFLMGELACLKPANCGIMYGISY